MSAINVRHLHETVATCVRDAVNRHYTGPDLPYREDGPLKDYYRLDAADAGRLIGKIEACLENKNYPIDLTKYIKVVQILKASPAGLIVLIMRAWSKKVAEDAKKLTKDVEDMVGEAP